MLKQNLQEATRKYKADNVEEDNLSPKEKRELKSLTDPVKYKDIVIMSTYKSGRHRVDTTINYRESVERHIGYDVIVDKEQQDEAEAIMYAHVYTWMKILHLDKYWKSLILEQELVEQIE